MLKRILFKISSLRNRKVLAFILAAAVLAGGAGWYCHDRFGNHTPAESVQGLVVADNAVDWWGSSSTSDSQPASGTKIPGYETLYASCETGVLKTNLLNPPDNTCYFQYELSLDGSGKVLAASDLLPPGKALENYALSNIPDPGSYPVCLSVNTYSMDGSLQQMNEARIKAVLIVS